MLMTKKYAILSRVQRGHPSAIHLTSRKTVPLNITHSTINTVYRRHFNILEI